MLKKMTIRRQAEGTDAEKLAAKKIAAQVVAAVVSLADNGNFERMLHSENPLLRIAADELLQSCSPHAKENVNEGIKRLVALGDQLEQESRLRATTAEQRQSELEQHYAVVLDRSVAITERLTHLAQLNTEHEARAVERAMAVQNIRALSAAVSDNFTENPSATQSNFDFAAQVFETFLAWHAAGVIKADELVPLMDAQFEESATSLLQQSMGARNFIAAEVFGRFLATTLRHCSLQQRVDYFASLHKQNGVDEFIAMAFESGNKIIHAHMLEVLGLAWDESVELRPKIRETMVARIRAGTIYDAFSFTPLSRTRQVLISLVVGIATDPLVAPEDVEKATRELKILNSGILGMELLTHALLTLEAPPANASTAIQDAARLVEDMSWLPTPFTRSPVTGITLAAPAIVARLNQARLSDPQSPELIAERIQLLRTLTRLVLVIPGDPQVKQAVKDLLAAGTIERWTGPPFDNTRIFDAAIMLAARIANERTHFSRADCRGAKRIVIRSEAVSLVPIQATLTTGLAYTDAATSTLENQKHLIGLYLGKELWRLSVGIAHEYVADHLSHSGAHRPMAIAAISWIYKAVLLSEASRALRLSGESRELAREMLLLMVSSGDLEKLEIDKEQLRGLFSQQVFYDDPSLMQAQFAELFTPPATPDATPTVRHERLLTITGTLVALYHAVLEELRSPNGAGGASEEFLQLVEGRYFPQSTFDTELVGKLLIHRIFQEIWTALAAVPRNRSGRAIEQTKQQRERLRAAFGDELVAHLEASAAPASESSATSAAKVTLSGVPGIYILATAEDIAAMHNSPTAGDQTMIFRNLWIVQPRTVLEFWAVVLTGVPPNQWSPQAQQFITSRTVLERQALGDAIELQVTGLDPANLDSSSSEGLVRSKFLQLASTSLHEHAVLAGDSKELPPAVTVQELFRQMIEAAMVDENVKAILRGNLQLFRQRFHTSVKILLGTLRYVEETEGAKAEQFVKNLKALIAAALLSSSDGLELLAEIGLEAPLSPDAADGGSGSTSLSSEVARKLHGAAAGRAADKSGGFNESRGVAWLEKQLESRGDEISVAPENALTNLALLRALDDAGRAAVVLSRSRVLQLSEHAARLRLPGRD
jgi:hypothetical protein